MRDQQLLEFMKESVNIVFKKSTKRKEMELLMPQRRDREQN